MNKLNQFVTIIQDLQGKLGFAICCQLNDNQTGILAFKAKYEITPLAQSNEYMLLKYDSAICSNSDLNSLIFKMMELENEYRFYSVMSKNNNLK